MDSADVISNVPPYKDSNSLIHKIFVLNRYLCFCFFKLFFKKNDIRAFLFIRING